MSAVLGGDPEAVVTGIEALGLTPANVNGAGQVVAAGALDALEKLAADPPGGGKVRPLTVAGAFHTHFMEPARERFGAVAAGVPVTDTDVLLLSNADGTAVSRGPAVLDRLVGQLTRSVRWDLCQATLRHLGVRALIELPPAGTLAGIARRELPGVEMVKLRTPDDLPAAKTLLARFTSGGEGEYTPDWRMVMAPVGGTFSIDAVAEGTWVKAGSRLGAVRTRKDDLQVSASYDGVLVEWLLEDGDLVDAGEPVARLVPGTAEEAR
jgi:[acyl-carrier-protein] S-malonyltransferase